MISAGLKQNLNGYSPEHAAVLKKLAIRFYVVENTIRNGYKSVVRASSLQSLTFKDNTNFIELQYI
jgi:hypothetical protein